MNVIEDTLEEPANPVNIPDNLLRCSGACYALQKTFSHKDELNLHMEFYHVEQAKASSQWLSHNLLTYNCEGYHRTKFYLSNIIKKHNPLFMFLQETWLPQHEGNIPSCDFSLYNFHTTSADMYVSKYIF